MSYEHWYPHTGFCPMYNKERTINVKYIEFQFDDFKKMDDGYCPEQISCKFVDKNGRCSLYKSAPDEPI